jgi:hypothetical protein
MVARLMLRDRIAGAQSDCRCAIGLQARRNPVLSGAEKEGKLHASAYSLVRFGGGDFGGSAG